MADRSEQLPPGVDLAEPGPAASSFRWTRAHVIALVILNLAGLLDAVDITVINVALPSIGRGVGISPTGLAWVVNAYLVVFGGFLLLGGRAGDLLGRRRVFLGGVVIFTLASLACGIAHNAAMLVVARGVQGLGAALVAPMTLAMLAVLFPAGPARTRAFAIGGLTFGVSGALGLIAGGLIVTGPGWRWIFFVNVPVGAAIVVAALRYLPAGSTLAGSTRAGSTRAGLTVAGSSAAGSTVAGSSAARPADEPVGAASAAARVPAASGRRRFDATGAIASTAGLSLLAYAVVQTAAHHWGSTRTVGLLAAAALLLGYFVGHEAAVATEPLVPPSLLGNRSVAAANVVSALLGGAMFATLYFATLYQQQVLGRTALRTGLAFLPMTGTLVVAAGLGPLLVSWIGIRYVIPGGALIAAAGLGLLARISPDGSVVGNFIGPSIVLSLGFAIMFIPMTIAALDGVPASESGVAAALLNVTRYLGGVLGLAAIATAATARSTHLAATGRPYRVALTSGFALGFGIGAGLMLAAAAAGLALFRNAGRGERVNILQLQSATLDG